MLISEEASIRVKGSGQKTAFVIGSGFGGLAAAIRLQSRGFDVTIVENRDKPGGRAYVFEDNGFVFDAGPTVITAPHCLEELFSECGRSMSDYFTLLKVSPFYRLLWDDGYEFDYDESLERTLEQIRRLSPNDEKGYLQFLDYSKTVFEAGYEKLVHVPFPDLWSMVKVAPQLIKLQAYRSVYSMVAKYIQDEHLRQAFSFHSLLVGGNPFNTSSIYTLIHFLERKWGVFFAKGGTGAIVNGLVQLFKDLGGKLQLNTKAEQIVIQGNQVVGIRIGEKILKADLVVSNADIVHTYKNLLGESKISKITASKMENKQFSMSLFLIYFGTSKKYENIAHHTVLFGPRYRNLLDDIFKKGVLPEDFSLYLHRPTATDSKLAPAGCESFYVLAPVAHMGKLSIDWEFEKRRYADSILDYLERRCLPDLRKNIVTERIFTPKDFSTELMAHHGSAFSLEPRLTQSAYFRAPNKDPNLKGLYFVGAGTHPGAGVPGVINSAKATFGIIEKDFYL